MVLISSRILLARNSITSRGFVTTGKPTSVVVGFTGTSVDIQRPPNEEEEACRVRAAAEAAALERLIQNSLPIMIIQSIEEIKERDISLPIKERKRENEPRLSIWN